MTTLKVCVVIAEGAVMTPVTLGILIHYGVWTFLKFGEQSDENPEDHLQWLLPEDTGDTMEGTSSNTRPIGFSSYSTLFIYMARKEMTLGLKQ